MKEELFQYRQMTLSYLQWGEGEDVLLCFHGFGRTAVDFELFLPLRRPNQRIIAINLLAHGSSRFASSRPYLQALKPHEWIECLSVFLAEKNVHQFHLFGYSMGGRIALCTWQWMPDRVKSVILLATDGLKKNLLYRFASGTRIGRAIYRHCIDHPEALFRLVGLLHRSKLLPPKLFRFVHVHLDSREKRQQVYDAWLVYRHFFPDLNQLGQIHRTSTIPVALLFGQHDSIIRPRLARKLTDRFHTPVNVILLPSGHRLFNQITVDALVNYKIWPGYS